MSEQGRIRLLGGLDVLQELRFAVLDGGISMVYLKNIKSPCGLRPLADECTDSQ